MAHKLKCDTIQNSKKLKYNFKKRETLNRTCASNTLNTRKKIEKQKKIQNVLKKLNNNNKNKVK